MLASSLLVAASEPSALDIYLSQGVNYRWSGAKDVKVCVERADLFGNDVFGKRAHHNWDGYPRVYFTNGEAHRPGTLEPRDTPQRSEIVQSCSGLEVAQTDDSSPTFENFCCSIPQSRSFSKVVVQMWDRETSHPDTLLGSVEVLNPQAGSYTGALKIQRSNCWVGCTRDRGTVFFSVATGSSASPGGTSLQVGLPPPYC